MRRFQSFAVAAGIVLAVAIAFSACGGGMMGDGMRGMHGPVNQAPQTPVASDAAQVTVEIRDIDFFPRDLTVKPGTSVTWVNRDPVPHDATEVDGKWGTGTLSQGESASITLETSGVFDYLCTIHPNMKATLRVQ